MSKIKIEDINGINLNFFDVKIVIIVAIHNMKIDKSLNKKSLLMGGIELFIKPNL